MTEKKTITTNDGEKDVTISGSNNIINTENGTGEVEITGDNNTFSTTGGNTEIEIQGNTNNISTGTGHDNITIKGDNNTATSGDGNDAFIIEKGNSNNIDGNSGYNTMINYGENTTHQNVIDITPDPVAIRLQVGANSEDSITITIDLKLYNFELDYSTPESSLENIETIDELQNTINEQRSKIGATLNRLNSAIESQQTKIENLTSSRSTIIDADISEESANYVKNQILQQTSAKLCEKSDITTNKCSPLDHNPKPPPRLDPQPAAIADFGKCASMTWRVIASPRNEGAAIYKNNKMSS